MIAYERLLPASGANALYAEGGASRYFVLVELGGDAVEDGLMTSGYAVPDGAAFAPDVRLELLTPPNQPEDCRLATAKPVRARGEERGPRSTI